MLGIFSNAFWGNHCGEGVISNKFQIPCFVITTYLVCTVLSLEMQWCHINVENITSSLNKHFVSMSIFPLSLDSTRELPRANTLPITIKQTVAHQRPIQFYQNQRCNHPTWIWSCWDIQYNNLIIVEEEGSFFSFLEGLGCRHSGATQEHVKEWSQLWKLIFFVSFLEKHNFITLLTDFVGRNGLQSGLHIYRVFWLTGIIICCSGDLVIRLLLSVVAVSLLAQPTKTSLGSGESFGIFKKTKKKYNEYVWLMHRAPSSPSPKADQAG